MSPGVVLVEVVTRLFLIALSSAVEIIFFIIIRTNQVFVDRKNISRLIKNHSKNYQLLFKK